MGHIKNSLYEVNANGPGHDGLRSGGLRPGPARDRARTHHPSDTGNLMKFWTILAPTTLALGLAGCDSADRDADAGEPATAIEGTEAAADRSMREAEAAIDAQADAAAANAATNETDAPEGGNEQ